MLWSKKTILNLSTLLMTVAILLVISIGNAKADFIFGEPVNLGPTINTSSHEDGPAISADGLELYFESSRPGGFGSWDIWVATRVSVDDDWGEPSNLGSSVNSSDLDVAPGISADGLELYFTSWTRDFISVMRRATKSDDWGPVEDCVSGGDIWAHMWTQTISSDGLEMYVCGDPPDSFGGGDLYMSTRPSVSDLWNTPQNLGPTVNSSAYDGPASISADGLMLFFRSERPGGYGGPDNEDIWVSRRTTTEDPWGTPVNLGPIVNSPYDEGGPCISADGRTLYFHSYKRPGGYGGQDLYKASIDPVVDLNGDGIVDAADMCIIVDNWGTDNSLCDIGPMPWGDGIVDVEDLIAVSEHLFEEVNDPTLAAHWALDETEGMLAVDSVGNNDAYVMGDPLWRPTGGIIGGALELDGESNYIISSINPNPTEGSFSVITWIKGGAPGQVIVSQPNGYDWLAVDVEGKLMTELKGVGRSAGPLFSEAVITDGQWHHIGLVWNGSSRILYVDGVKVAEDTQPSLEDTQIGLNIGKGIQADSYFSGLIDDIRIYNRAVHP